MALETFGRTGGRARVRDFAEAVGLSQRRFMEVFTAEDGLTPKLFSRVQRLQQALARRTPAPEWAQLASDCGYFDQSHLIRDFVEFSGYSLAD